MLQGLIFIANSQHYYINDVTLLTLTQNVVGRLTPPSSGTNYNPRSHTTSNASYTVNNARGFVNVWQELARQGLHNAPVSYFNIGGQQIEKEKDSFYMYNVPRDTNSQGQVIPLSYPNLLRDMRALGASDQTLASDLRNVMKNPLTHQNEKRILPVLAAVMFIAEPARNPRAFAINLMLLDLIEKGVTYGSQGIKHYTWDNVLWHPEAVGPGHYHAGSQPNKPQQGSTDRTQTGGVGAITQRMDLHMTGGKLPAAMTGSGPGFIRAQINPARYYTQQKEVTVLIRWLYNKIIDPKTGNRRLGIYRRGVAPTGQMYNNSPQSIQDQVSGAIRNAIQARCQSLDQQLP